MTLCDVQEWRLTADDPFDRCQHGRPTGGALCVQCPCPGSEDHLWLTLRIRVLPTASALYLFAEVCNHCGAVLSGPPLMRYAAPAVQANVSGSMRGKRQAMLIVDDPLLDAAAPSAEDMEKAREWYANTMAGRNGETVDQARARVGLPPLEEDD